MWSGCLGKKVCDSSMAFVFACGETYSIVALLNCPHGAKTLEVMPLKKSDSSPIPSLPFPLISSFRPGFYPTHIASNPPVSKSLAHTQCKVLRKAFVGSKLLGLSVHSQLTGWQLDRLNAQLPYCVRCVIARDTATQAVVTSKSCPR